MAVEDCRNSIANALELLQSCANPSKCLFRQNVCFLLSAKQSAHSAFNTLRRRQNGRHFAGDTFNRIFVNENGRISIKFSLKFVPKGPINNIPALVQLMAWRRPDVTRPLMSYIPSVLSFMRFRKIFKGWNSSLSFIDNVFLIFK